MSKRQQQLDRSKCNAIVGSKMSLYDVYCLCSDMTDREAYECRCVQLNRCGLPDVAGVQTYTLSHRLAEPGALTE